VLVVSRNRCLQVECGLIQTGAFRIRAFAYTVIKLEIDLVRPPLLHDEFLARARVSIADGIGRTVKRTPLS